ncbi:MAG: anaerobic ribonucleoside-triphosphate reductase activating protein [Spirochaetales bacterium]|nr:anaerobic ribonucleoside-triphosphate reductase activating protein [Spirochaetales bacterium]
MDYFGLQKTTLIDFPGILAATIFIPGCNLRCPYCHNPELVTKIRPDTLITYNELISFLNKRKNIVGGVCLSGGEPVLYKGLAGLIDTIHSLGMKVKIDTNGTLPDKLDFQAMDYIAMDIKTIPGKYHLLGNHIPGAAGKINESISRIISSGIPHEFRTTIAPGIVEREDIKEICSLIKGADSYVLSQFRPLHTLDPGYEQMSPTSWEMLKELKEIVEKANIPCKIRYVGKSQQAP